MTVQVVGAPRQDDGNIVAPPSAIDAAAADQPSAITATNGSLAARMLAEAQEIAAATEEFPVPGWERDGQPTLVLVARQLSERIKERLTNEKFIIDSTVQLLYRDDNGDLVEMPGGWAGVALEMGKTFSTGDAVRMVLSNPLRLDAFAAEVLAWNAGRRQATEDALGE